MVAFMTRIPTSPTHVPPRLNLFVLSQIQVMYCHATQISLSGTVLEESSNIRLVGVTLAKDISSNECVISIAKQASMKVGSLYQARHYRTPVIILHLY